MAIIVVIAVVLAVAVAAIILSRKRKAVANRNKAAEIREQAQAQELAAMEREAKAARAEADAKQAEVEAERLRRAAVERQHEAESTRAGLQEQLRKADKLDPDSRATGHGGDAAADEDGKRDGKRLDGGTEQLLRDRARRKHAADGTAADAGENQDRGDRPRNL